MRRLRGLTWPPGERAAAAGAGLAAVLAAGYLQLAGRGPLEWDEAIRVEAGWHLAYLLRQGDLAGAWTWLNDQTFYPFLLPAVHGLLMLLGVPPPASAWLPGLACFGLAVYLVHRLAAKLGAALLGRWLAVSLVLLIPLEWRLAPTGLTELPGLCLYLGLLLALARLAEGGGVGAGLLAGLLVVLASWLKWDYGLIAGATLLAAGVVAMAGGGRRQALPGYAAALAAAVVLGGGLLLDNLDAKVQGTQYFAPGVYPGPRDPFYILGEVAGQDGLWPPMTALLLSGAAAGAALWRMRPAVRPVLSFVLISYAAYTLANNRGHQRYFAPALAVLAVLAAAGVEAAARALQARLRGRASRRAWGAAAACALVVALPQLPALGTRLGFVQPDPAADAIGSFAVAHLPPAGVTGYIGASDEVSPYAVMVAEESRLGTPSGPVEYVPEAAPGARWQGLLDFLQSREPALVIAVDIPPGSRLDTPDHRAVWPGQDEYFRDAEVLGLRGCLTDAGQAFTDAGRIEVIAWTIPAGTDFSRCGGPP